MTDLHRKFSKPDRPPDEVIHYHVSHDRLTEMYDDVMNLALMKVAHCELPTADLLVLIDFLLKRQVYQGKDIEAVFHVYYDATDGRLDKRR